MISLTLPYPPSVNHYWRHVPNRGTLISKEGREYRIGVIGEIMLIKHLHNFPLEGRLAVLIHATMPDRRKRDIENIQKALLDSLEHAGVYLDDSQIDDLRIIRCGVDPEKKGNVDVIISVINRDLAPDVSDER